MRRLIELRMLAFGASLSAMGCFGYGIRSPVNAPARGDVAKPPQQPHSRKIQTTSDLKEMVHVLRLSAGGIGGGRIVQQAEDISPDGERGGIWGAIVGVSTHLEPHESWGSNAGVAASEAIAEDPWRIGINYQMAWTGTDSEQYIDRLNLLMGYEWFRANRLFNGRFEVGPVWARAEKLGGLQANACAIAIPPVFINYCLQSSYFVKGGFELAFAMKVHMHLGFHRAPDGP